MTREDLLNEINKKIEEEGGAFSMTKVDVAVFCYNLALEHSVSAVWNINLMQGEDENGVLLNSDILNDVVEEIEKHKITQLKAPKPNG